MGERFPNHAGTDSILVTLYIQDSLNGPFTEIDTLRSGNWMGRRGNLFFTSLLPGDYRLQIHLPPGYTVVHPDSMVYENGWSDTLHLAGDSTLRLGTVLLVPSIATDSSLVVPGMEEVISDVTSGSSGLTIYPNPTTGLIKFEFPGASNLDYTVFNYLGQAILNGKADSGSEIDLSGQVNGMYFVQMQKGSEFIGTKRILLLQGR